jgi:hypothetical protein
MNDTGEPESSPVLGFLNIGAHFATLVLTPPRRREKQTFTPSHCSAIT